MSQLDTYIDPTTTSQILKNLTLAIDETKLIINLNNLNNLVSTIESSGMPTVRSEYLRKEITVLKVQLNYIRDRASLNNS